MALPETLVRQRSATVYLKDETTSGTLSAVPAAGDAFALTTVPVIAQAGNYTDTSEIGSEMITTKKVLNYMDYATFDLEFYSKPQGDGADGHTGNVEAPVEDFIMTKFFGGKSTSGTGVLTYYLKNTTPTFSTWSQQFTDQSVQLYAGAGCIPTSWGVSLAKDGPVTFSIGLQSNHVHYAGTAEIASAASQAFVLSGPTRYDGAAMVASDVMFNGLTVDVLDTNASYAVLHDSVEIENVATTGFDFVSGTAASGSIAAGDLVVPSLPAPACAAAPTIDQRNVAFFMANKGDGDTLVNPPVNSGDIFHADNKLNVTAVSVDVDRSLTTPGLNEMSGSEFPTAAYVINEPTISGSVTMLMRPKDFQMLNGLRDAPLRAFGIEIDSGNGRTIQIAAPAAHFEVPTPGEADGATQIDLSFTVVKDADCDDADKFIVRYT